MARRTKLTPEVQTLIAKYVRAGAFDYVAAEAVGITAQTFCNWMRWGEKGNPRYVSFFESITKAHAEARVTAEARVFQERPEAWLGKGPGRSKPGRDGWTERTEVTGADGGPVRIRAESLSDDELAAIAAGGCARTSEET